MELGALIVGYLLGGKAGIGTVITAVGLGYFIQVIFKLCNFKTENVVHRSILEDINYVRLCMTKDIDEKLQENK